MSRRTKNKIIIDNIIKSENKVLEKNRKILSYLFDQYQKDENNQVLVRLDTLEFFKYDFDIYSSCTKHREIHYIKDFILHYRGNNYFSIYKNQTTKTKKKMKTQEKITQITEKLCPILKECYDKCKTDYAEYPLSSKMRAVWNNSKAFAGSIHTVMTTEKIIETKRNMIHIDGNVIGSTVLIKWISPVEPNYIMAEKLVERADKRLKEMYDDRIARNKQEDSQSTDKPITPEEIAGYENKISTLEVNLATANKTIIEQSNKFKQAEQDIKQWKDGCDSLIKANHTLENTNRSLLSENTFLKGRITELESLKPRPGIKKCDLWVELGTSQNTLHKFANVQCFEELVKVGYRKNQRILTQEQADLIRKLWQESGGKLQRKRRTTTKPGFWKRLFGRRK